MKLLAILLASLAVLVQSTSVLIDDNGAMEEPEDRRRLNVSDRILLIHPECPGFCLTYGRGRISYGRCRDQDADYWNAQEFGKLGFFKLVNNEANMCIPEPEFCGDSPGEIFDLVDCHDSRAALFNRFGSDLLLYSARCFIQVGTPTVFGTQRNCQKRVGWSSQGEDAPGFVNWLTVAIEENVSDEIFGK